MLPSREGSLAIVVGRPGSGKTFATLRGLNPLSGVITVYHSPNLDDLAPSPPWVHVPPAHVPRLGRLPPLIQLTHCRALDALMFADRLAAARIRLRLVLDEAHEVAPNYGQTWVEKYSKEERAWVRAWVLTLLRRGRHSTTAVVMISSTIAGLHPEVWKFASTTTYFQQSERCDLDAIVVRYNLGAAIQVGRLQPRQSIVVPRDNPPPGWEGYVETLAARAREGRHG